MNIKFVVCLLILSCYGITNRGLFAQSSAVDFQQYPNAIYEDYLVHHLYKGRQFIPYLLTATGSPNFKGLDMIDDGVVIYDGLKYENVPLMYNLMDDVVVSRHPDRMVNLILESHLVSHFKIGDDVFIRVSVEHPELNPGFYQLIYSGDNFLALAKFRKEVKDYRSGSSLERRYTQSSNFYVNDLRTDQGFVEVGRHSDILKIDRDERSAVRRLLRNLSLRFRSMPEHTIVTALTFLEETN